jgi:histidine triad (HIT) family protein
MKKLTILQLLLLLILSSCTNPADINKPQCTSTQLTSNTYRVNIAGGYNPENITELFNAAQDIAHKHPSTGYRITTGIITPTDTQQAAQVTLQLSGTPGNITNAPGAHINCIFCAPTTPILYDDGRVRVIKKLGNRPGTDILIIPKQHVATNIDTLNFNNPPDRDLIKHIVTVAGKIAQHLKGTDKRYHLMTNAGIYQGVYHLHVHFKSAAELDEQAFMQSK